MNREAKRIAVEIASRKCAAIVGEDSFLRTGPLIPGNGEKLLALGAVGFLGAIFFLGRTAR